MAPPTDYSVRQVDDITVVRLEIESLMGSVEVGRLSGELMAMVEGGGVRKLVLDLQRVRFVGSVALGMLMGMRTKLSQLGGKLVLCHTEHIDQLLKITRARHLFTLAADADAAVASIRG